MIASTVESPSGTATNHALIVFGATGSMARRKLLPALCNLYREGTLPEISLTCVANHSTAEMERALLEAFQTNAFQGRSSDYSTDSFDRFLTTLGVKYVAMDITKSGADSSYGRLSGILREFLSSRIENAFVTYYFAVSPEHYHTIAINLANHGLLADGHTVVLEKPYGVNEESTKQLLDYLADRGVTSFLVDHYLFKPMVETIMELRVKMVEDSRYRPLAAVWNDSYIDHVQISVLEKEGIGQRGGFYDKTGALHDMIQNHLLQVLCVITARPVKDQSSGRVESWQKLEVLAAILAKLAQASKSPKPGQFGQSMTDWIVLDQYRGYNEEDGVGENSRTETYAALKLELEGLGWDKTSFFLRTGKRLNERAAAVVVEFRNGERLIFHIQPNPRIVVRRRFENSPLSMLVEHDGAIDEEEDAYRRRRPASQGEDETSDGAYESILAQVLKGSLEPNVDADWIFRSWQLMDRIRRQADWHPMDIYEPDTDGPEAASELIERTGTDRRWLMLW